MITITDQTGQTISLSFVPSRIVSVVPSQTELLFHLGLEVEVVGITKFCIHPQHWFKSKTRVGGTKTLNIELIKQLNPGIIFANKEENTEEQIKELIKEFPVYTSDIKNLDEALQMIADIGTLTGKSKAAQKVIIQIKINFQNLYPLTNRNAAYLIWQKPFMAAGGDTFINDMMKLCGLKNVLNHKNRYPQTSIEELNELNCDYLLLSSEPFPFKQQQVDEIKANGFKGQIILVDGEMFSWYGSRLLQAPLYFQELANKIRN